jgi:hypothetical protein
MESRQSGSAQFLTPIKQMMDAPMKLGKLRAAGPDRVRGEIVMGPVRREVMLQKIDGRWLLDDPMVPETPAEVAKWRSALDSVNEELEALAEKVESGAVAVAAVPAEFMKLATRIQTAMAPPTQRPQG